ncbi:MAG: AarF/ABC1/UbiB kinase family protein [Deltaproteobacteria bacterium]|nr:AarF/ABC1/UbiB kinase family protein [Deltaproteobacteria bacterium]
MKPWTRIRRSALVARTVARLWLIYKVPVYTRRLLGRPALKGPELDPTHERAAKVVLATALAMRGVIIKSCQFIATRSDVFPPAFIEELKQLHDAVPAKPFAVVKETIEQELGRPIPEVFAALDEQPVAAASLAQVHLGRLHDGREVAVKVQYPDIEEIIQLDIRNMKRACRVYERFEPQPLPLMPLLNEMTKHIGFELDFLREADSADRVRELFKDDDGVKVPEIHREWSTRRVLVMEKVGGMKITDAAALKAAGIDPADVVQDLMAVWVRMIMGAGFFQADPHPGNLFVTKDRQLVLLDFGLSKELPEGFGLGIFELMFSMMTRSEAAMIRAFQELGFRTKTGDTSHFVQIARRMLDRSETGRFEGEFTEEMTDEMFDAVREDPLVAIPSDFVLVGRSFGMLSGIAHTLGARANVLQAMGGG